MLGATFYDRINTIYQFIKLFLGNKMSVFEEYGTFYFFRVFSSKALLLTLILLSATIVALEGSANP